MNGGMWRSEFDDGEGFWLPLWIGALIYLIMALWWLARNRWDVRTGLMKLMIPEYAFRAFLLTPAMALGLLLSYIFESRRVFNESLDRFFGQKAGKSKNI